MTGRRCGTVVAVRTELPRSQAGFTISELVLVLAVLAALLAAITWGIRGMDEDAATRDCRTELRTLKAAVQQYHAELGRYPSDDGALDEAGILARAETPNWKVVTEGEGDAAEPSYLPEGDRCA